MRTKLFAASAAFCILAITGCSNEIDEVGTPTGKQAVMTMQAAADAPQTRADYTDDDTKMNFSWRRQDQLSVVVDGVEGNNNCALATQTESKSAPFGGVVTAFEGTKTIYAFYPYLWGGYVVTGGHDKATATAALTLPNPQLYTIGGAISNSILVGVGSATANGTNITASASMKQVMSIIKLNITKASAEVTGVKLKCAEAVFPTTATVKLSDATMTNPGNLKNELSMKVVDKSTALVKEVSFAMFPTNLTGKKIEVEVSFADNTSKTIEKDGTDFLRNMHYVMVFDGTPAPPPITWAKGNLIADGANGAMIGEPTDAGLFFQFGSLIGWSPTGTYPTIVIRPVGFNGNEKWDDTGKIWQGKESAVPFTEKNSGSADEKAGVGDPCRYYLGDIWRLPTREEYKNLFAGYPASGWQWENTATTNSTKGLTFPASGYRDYDTSILTLPGEVGYYWSTSSFYAGRDGYELFLTKTSVTTRPNYRATGSSVRCVQSK